MSDFLARPGKPPVQVIINGVSIDSGAARELFPRVKGLVGQFLGAARTRTDGLEQGHAARKVPGIDMRYQINQGQEKLVVRIDAEMVSRLLEQPTIPEPKRTATPILAVDVLLRTELYEAGDVTSYEDVLITPADPGEVGAPFPPQGQWTYFFDPSLEDREPIFSPDNPAQPGQEEPNGTYTEESGYFLASEVMGPYLTTPAGIGIVGGRVDINGPSVYDGDGPGVVVYGAPLVDAEGRARFRAEFGWYFPPAPIPRDPTPEVRGKLYQRDVTSRFDTLYAVGLRVGDPDKGGYEIISGTEEPQEQDNRLKALILSPTLLSAERAMTVDGEESFNQVGHGFVVRPSRPDEDKVVIEVFAASCNIRKFNAYPDGEGSTLEADDPTFSYEPKDPNLALWTVRAREFVDQSPVAVRVQYTTEQEVQHYSPEPTQPPPDESGNLPPATPGYDKVPDIPSPPVTSDSPRTPVWHFAALEDWTDPGDGDPTLDPSQESLGRLLGEAEGGTIVTGPDPLERELPDTLNWKQPLAEMTQIARIEWTPATPTREGKARITTP